MTHPNEVSTKCHLALRTRMGRSWPQQKESVELWNACSIRSSRSCDQISVDWQTDTHTDTKRGCLCLNSWILGYTPQITVSCWCPSLAHCCRCPSSGEPLVAPRFWSELCWINSLHHTDDFSVPVNDGADPSAPAPSGASSRFRSSIRTRAWWHHQCPISTWSVKLWGLSSCVSAGRRSDCRSAHPVSSRRFSHAPFCAYRSSPSHRLRRRRFSWCIMVSTSSNWSVQSARNYHMVASELILILNLCASILLRLGKADVHLSSAFLALNISEDLSLLVSSKYSMLICVVVSGLSVTVLVSIFRVLASPSMRPVICPQYAVPSTLQLEVVQRRDAQSRHKSRSLYYAREDI